MTNTVRVFQFPDATGTETYTLTATLGASTRVYTFGQSDGIDLLVSCDALKIERTGTFTELNLTPEPALSVCLTKTVPLVSPCPSPSCEGVTWAVYFACGLFCIFLALRRAA